MFVDIMEITYICVTHETPYFCKDGWSNKYNLLTMTITNLKQTTHSYPFSILQYSEFLRPFYTK